MCRAVKEGGEDGRSSSSRIKCNQIKINPEINPKTLLFHGGGIGRNRDQMCDSSCFSEFFQFVGRQFGVWLLHFIRLLFLYISKCRPCFELFSCGMRERGRIGFIDVQVNIFKGREREIGIISYWVMEMICCLISF